MKKILFLSLALPFMITDAMQNPTQTSNMPHKIWRHFIDILKYRQDLKDVINPFFDNLNNRSLNDNQHIPFLKNLSCFQLKTLWQLKIINDNKVTSLDKGALLAKWEAEMTELARNPEVIGMIKEDNLEALQTFHNEKTSIENFKIITFFNGAKKVVVPLIHYAIMQNAEKCFKYMLINGLGDPQLTTRKSQKLRSCSLFRRISYEWDCMALAIYHRNFGVISILEEKGIEKGNHASHLEAALLSYRNYFAKEILEKLKEQDSKKLKGDLAKLFPTVIKNNNIEGMEFLISNGVNINSKDNNRSTFLHFALEKNRKEIAEILIPKGADINAKDNFGKTPLHLALEKNSKDIVELLISKGADINSKDNNGKTSLHLALEKNRKEIAEILISKGADVNAKDNGGRTPLHFAAWSNSKDLVQLLILKGADVNAKDNFGSTPLHSAAWSNSKDLIQLLILKGADVNAKDKESWTPLLIAAYNNSKDISEVLMFKGANIDAKYKYGKTPLHFAAKNNSKEIGEILISKGADINVKDDDGSTPLHFAAKNNSKEIFELLISKGANINAKDYRGRTPLHFAAADNSREIGEILTSKGADINAKANDGKTPRDYGRDWLK